MTKTVLFALLAVAGSLVVPEDAFARHCRRSCWYAQASCCAAAPCTSSCNACAASCDTCTAGCSASTAGDATPVAATTAPATDSSGTSYQSFSYEPNGSAPAANPAPVVYQAPMVRRSTYSIYDSVLRGDRKVRGQF